MNLILPNPLPHQSDIIFTEKRRALVIAGRRAGKSTAAMIRCVLRALQHKENIWWVAPIYKQVEPLWDMLQQTCKDFPIDKQSKSIRFPNGGAITIKSADSPDALRGSIRPIDGVVLDEAAFINELIYKTELMPLMADSRGWLLAISTPNGMNWLYDLWTKVQNDPIWFTARYPSSINPIIAKEDLHQIKQDIGPLAYAQEHDAEFVSMEGSLFDSSWFKDIFVSEIPEEYQLSCIATDASTGVATGDWSANCFVGFVNNEYYVDIDLARRPVTQIVSDLISLYDLRNPQALVVETIGFQQVVAQELIKQFAEKNKPLPVIIEVNHHSKKKADRISRLASWLSRGLIKIRNTPSGQELVKQLMSFPSGDHDDGPDALEMAMQRCK